jgi:hypothetical protein
LILDVVSGTCDMQTNIFIRQNFNLVKVGCENSKIQLLLAKNGAKYAFY